MNDNAEFESIAAEGVTQGGTLVSDELKAAVQQYLVREKYLTDLGAKLERQKDEAAMWRMEFEPHWAISLRQYNTGNVETVPDAKDNNQRGKVEQDRYRASPDNITRTITNSIIARRQDMLFSGTNWGIEPSPRATLPPFVMQQLVAQAQQMGATPTQIATMVQGEAEKRCKRMSAIIADRLAESRYEKHGRAAVEDSCKLGTGVLEGPFPQVVERRIWNGTTIETVYDIVQRVERVEPTCFFPQPCRNIEEAEYAFRLHVMTKTQVAALGKQPGFDPDQINNLLSKPPSMGNLLANVTVSANDPAHKSLKDRYPIFKYKGPVPRECLEYFGFGIPEEDKTTQFMGEAWFSMGVVIKAVLAADDWNARLPFYVINYEKNPDSCFGFSVASVVHGDQDTANVTWSAAKLNAMAAAVPIPGIVKQYMVDQDGNYDLSRPGPWILKGTDDIRKAISFTTVPSTSQAALEIYDRAKSNAREHTLMPESVQGPAAGTQQTASGLAMVMNSGNVIQRHAANQWDDEVTMPLIKAMVDYEMQYGEDMDAKGDYDVIPVAGTQLLVKDVRLQQGMALLQLCATNERIGLRVNQDVIADMILRDMSISVEKALRTDEQVAELEAQAQQQPDPEQMKLESAERRQQMESETRIQEAQAANDREIIKSQTNIAVAQLNRDAQLAQIAAQSDIKYEEIMRDMRIAEGEQALTAQMAETRALVANRNKDLDVWLTKLGIGAKAAAEAAKLEQRRESEQAQTVLEAPNVRF